VTIKHHTLEPFGQDQIADIGFCESTIKSKVTLTKTYCCG